MRRIISGLMTLVILAVAGFLAVNIVKTSQTPEGAPPPTTFGLSWAIVLSGSMEPEISVDDMVVAQAQEAYQVGDIITFFTGRSLVTHRIIGEDEAGFITQGDANNAPDAEPVAPEQILGKIILIIPRVGLYIDYIKTPLGLCSLCMAAVVIILLGRILGKSRDVTEE